MPDRIFVEIRSKIGPVDSDSPYVANTIRNEVGFSYRLTPPDHITGEGKLLDLKALRRVLELFAIDLDTRISEMELEQNGSPTPVVHRTLNDSGAF